MSFIELKRTFLSVVEAIEYVSEEDNSIDVIFLDINMPEMSGLKVRALIPKRIQIVFVTAYEEFAFESYELDVTDYLLKPISIERFYKAALKCRDRKKNTVPVSENKNTTILARGDKKVHQITIAEIAYIEGLKDYAKIYYGNNKKLIIRESLKTILAKLEHHNFMRVHRSFVVPLDKISAIYGLLIKIGDYEVPINKSQKELILKEFKERGILGDRSS